MLLLVILPKRKSYALLWNQYSDIVILVPQIFIMKMDILFRSGSDNIVIMVAFINKRNNVSTDSLSLCIITHGNRIHRNLDTHLDSIRVDLIAISIYQNTICIDCRTCI